MHEFLTEEIKLVVIKEYDYENQDVVHDNIFDVFGRSPSGSTEKKTNSVLLLSSQ